jgi:hypothetical protein
MVHPRAIYGGDGEVKVEGEHVVVHPLKVVPEIHLVYVEDQESPAVVDRPSHQTQRRDVRVLIARESARTAMTVGDS